MQALKWATEVDVIQRHSQYKAMGGAKTMHGVSEGALD